MKNPNLVSLLFTSLLISSISVLNRCNADASTQTELHRGSSFLGPWNNGLASSHTFDDRKTLKRRRRGLKRKYQRNTKDEEHHFSYTQGASDGPKKWGSVTSEWKACAIGKWQSPINIQVNITKVKPSDLRKAYRQAPARLVNTGHSIEVQWQGDAGGIEVNGTTYKLVQCHWHIPSEHAIDGKRFDAELHLVHSNAQEQKAVIGILHTIGDPDPFIGNLAEKIKMLGSKGIDLGRISASSIRCGSKKYYRYMGSLTTPGCDEGVIWTVADKVRSISQDQIQTLKGPLDHEFQENARPIQQVGERQVWQLDASGEKE